MSDTDAGVPGPNPWGWWWTAGGDPERYEGNYATREEAITAGRQSTDKAFTICEARHELLTDSIFRAENVVETFNEWNEDRAYIDSFTPAQGAELESALVEVFAAWRKRHGLGRAWTLETRNSELIEPDGGCNAD